MPSEAGSELTDLDFGTVSPEEFAKIVKGLSRKELAELMTGELRQRVLGEVFGRMEQQFRPEAAGSLKALIRWSVTGETETVYEATIEDGTCTVREGQSDATARVTLTLADADFLSLVSGNGSPVTMFMTRKLKLAGDVGLATGLTRFFDIPKA